MDPRRTLQGLVVVLACGVLAACPAGARVTYLPGHPTTNDLVNVQVAFNLPPGCWVPGTLVCGPVVNDTTLVTMPVGWAPCDGCGCDTVSVGYQGTCTLGPFSQGRHAVRFTEQHATPGDPMPSWSQTVSFQVVAAGSHITFAPAAPTSADTVVVTVKNWLTCPCWSASDIACATSGDTLELAVPVLYHGPDCNCVDMEVPYQFSCRFPNVPAGAHTIRFRERHTSPDPYAGFTELRALTVGAGTPVVRRTWGALKSAYR